MSRLPKPIHYGLLLLIIGGILGGLLVLVNSITAPIIAENEIKEVAPILETLVPTCDEFVPVTDEVEGLPSEVLKVYYGYEGDSVKAVIYWTETAAYGTLVMKELIAIDVTTDTIINVAITSSILTTHGQDSLFTKYDTFFAGKAVSLYANKVIGSFNGSSSEIISGATISSRGVVMGVIHATTHYNAYNWGF